VETCLHNTRFWTDDAQPEVTPEAEQLPPPIRSSIYELGAKKEKLKEEQAGLKLGRYRG
jgi:hypothetical protein